MSYFENSNLDETVDAVNTASLLVDIFKKDMTKDAKIILPSKKKNKNIFSDSDAEITDIIDILVDAGKKITDYLEKEDIIKSRKYLQTLNTIDFRQHNSDTIAYAKKLFDDFENIDFFEKVPCFEEGCIRLTNTTYYYWKIDSIDAVKKQCTLTVHKYTWHTDRELSYSSRWSIDATVSFSIDDSTDFLDIYISTEDGILQTCDYKEAGLTEDEIFVRNRINEYVSQNTGSDEEKCKAAEKRAHGIMTGFLTVIIMVNKALAKNSLSKGKSLTANKSKSTKSADTVIAETEKKKLTRTLKINSDKADTHEDIHIISEKPPKAPSENYVRHYSVAAWTVRATTRHYKSGKTVYIKETVHKRHALQKDNAENAVARKEYKIK